MQALSVALGSSGGTFYIAVPRAAVKCRTAFGKVYSSNVRFAVFQCPRLSSSDPRTFLELWKREIDGALAREKVGRLSGMIITF